MAERPGSDGAPGLEYDFDVYLSYASEESEKGGWLRHFSRLLERRLSEVVGRPARLFLDHQSLERTGKAFEKEALEALGRSALLVPMVDVEYWKSDWTRRELDYFWTRSGVSPGGGTALSRVIPVFLLPSSALTLPKPLQATQGVDFFELSGQEARVLQPGEKRFEGRLTELAAMIAGSLDALHSPTSEAEAPSTAQTPPSVGPPEDARPPDADVPPTAKTKRSRRKKTGKKAEPPKAAEVEEIEESGDPAQPGTEETGDVEDGKTPPSAAAPRDLTTLLGLEKVALTSDAEQLLAVAVNLLASKSPTSKTLSTTRLFFAAVEWGRAPEGVPTPPPGLAALAATVLSNAASGYQSLVSGYFSSLPLPVSTTLATVPADLRLSDNVRAAVGTLPTADEAPVSAAALMAAVFERLGAEGNDAKLGERLANLSLPTATLERTLFPEVSTHAASDLWTVDDKLGYMEYARAIYHFLRDPRTSPPLTISIQAPWGGGKTSLMRMIQSELDPVGYELARPAVDKPSTEAEGATASESSSGGAESEAASGGSSRRRRWWPFSAWLGKGRRYGGSEGAGARRGANVQEVFDELEAIAAGNPSPVEIDLGTGHYPTVWFNAWIYQSGKQIWAGLGEAIIRGLSERLDPVQREKFLLRLHLARVDPHAIRAKLYQAATQRFLGYLRGGLKWLVAGVAAATGLGIAAAAEAFTAVAGLLGPSSLGPAITGAALSAIATALAGYARALASTKSEPAELTLSDYLDVPDYGAELGFVHEVNRDLRRVLELLPRVTGPDGERRKAPIVLFIDDLDRCSPGKVAEVFEAINLFVAGEFPNCYVILGMDSEVVAAALEEAHKEVVERLPAYSRHTGVGWRFMDKFVQLPFVIPPMSPQSVLQYAEHLAKRESLAASKAQARAAELATPEKREEVDEAIEEAAADATGPDERPLQVAEKLKLGRAGEGLAREIIERQQRIQFIDRQAKQLTQDSREVEALLRQAHEEFSNNPRELKRLVNVYRFYMNLRLARLARGESVPTQLQMRNWVMLSLAWPEVFRWLRRGHTEWGTVESEEEAAPSRQLFEKLQTMAVAEVEETSDSDGKATKRPPQQPDWSRRLERLSGLRSDATPWLTDERLFRFFQRVAGAGEEGSLAAGAGRGFW